MGEGGGGRGSKGVKVRGRSGWWVRVASFGGGILSDSRVVEDFRLARKRFPAATPNAGEGGGNAPDPAPVRIPDGRTVGPVRPCPPGVLSSVSPIPPF